MKRLGGLTANRMALALQAAIVTLAAIFVIVLVQPLPIWHPPTLDQSAASPAVPPQPESPLDLAVLSARNLRQPPVDPPAPPPAASVPETPLAIRLIGTAIETERSFAVFGLPDSRTLVREVGGDVEGYEVMEVRRGSAKLRRGEREYEVRVPWFERIAAEAARNAGESP